MKTKTINYYLSLFNFFSTDIKIEECNGSINADHILIQPEDIQLASVGQSIIKVLKIPVMFLLSSKHI